MENRRDETPFFYNTARSPTQTPCTLYSLTPRYCYLFSPLIPGTRLQFHTDSPLLLVVFFIDRTRVFFDSKSDFFYFFFLGWIFLGWLLSQCSTDVTVLDCDSSACGDRSHGNFFSFFLTFSVSLIPMELCECLHFTLICFVYWNLKGTFRD